MGTSHWEVLAYRTLYNYSQLLFQLCFMRQCLNRHIAGRLDDDTSLECFATSLTGIHINMGQLNH